MPLYRRIVDTFRSTPTKICPAGHPANEEFGRELQCGLHAPIISSSGGGAFAGRCSTQLGNNGILAHRKVW